jgi:glycosyltransferase involved in cell wall biosynthesis
VARLRDKGDVLVFGYDFVYEDERDGKKGTGPICPEAKGTVPDQPSVGARLRENRDSPPASTWHPEEHSHRMFATNIVVPLGIAHRREWIDKLGGFNELVNPDEDWDFVRRLARAGARFAFFPLKSGRYHIRSTSRSRKPRVLRWQREAVERNWRAGRPIYEDGAATMKAKAVRKIAFASPHCLIDFTSGAAIATLQALRFLKSLGFTCQAFCGSQLDAPEEALFEELLANQKSPYETRNVQVGSYKARMTFTLQGQGKGDRSSLCEAPGTNRRLVRPFRQIGPVPFSPVPVTVFQCASTRGWWSSKEEAEAFLAAFGSFLDKNRPDLIVTYGGSPIAKGMAKLAKGRDIPVVFWLHNFSYQVPAAFMGVDYVVVPSDFSRVYHWEKLGLACHTLPNVLDPQRVNVAEAKPTYVTFVNPDTNKGVYIFARIAGQLARRRPDIPILVVEGRSRSRSIQQTGLDLSWAVSFNEMSNTPDPRDFYAVTKLLLMPSLGKESFGLVAAEAMLNGIPVLAGNRGALPEVVGDAGFVFPIAECYTPATRTVPTADEVECWIDTIIRLWDDPGFYQEWSQAARRRAQRWLPGQLAPAYKRFFGTISPQPGPPALPKSIP